ncbi:MAG TPA: beta-ketoacyl-ACP synthase III [Gemmataceae bacterium]|nr:beta-ketoacyl-ACP synthase III [Gemmataceae bacterium]
MRLTATEAGAAVLPAPAESLAPPAAERSRAARASARPARLTGFQVVATGSYVPDVVITNEALERTHGFEADWVRERTGIRERRHAAPHQATSDLCLEACRRCLRAAGARPEDVDLLIVASHTPDLSMPATANLLQDKLGAACGAFDIQAACSGFLYALAVGAQFVATGNARLCLVTAGDIPSRIINPADRLTYPLFGDAAGAVLLAAGAPGQGFLAYQLGSDGSGALLLHRPAGGSLLPLSEEALAANLHYFQMDGKPVYRWAVQTIVESVGAVLRQAGLTAADVQLFVPHQANLRILRSAAERLGLPPEKVWTNLDRYGNTVAASVPLALDEAVAAGRVRRGDPVVLCGFGSGLSWGTALLSW